jgi:PAS domain S-box-containing protein
MSSKRQAAAVETMDHQAAFFARMGGRQQFQALFEHLPGVCFFVKDADGRFMAANELCLKRMGFASEADVVGKTDADVHPERVAREIREDDLRVMKSRKPLVDRVEALFIRSQAKDWYSTTKLPVFDTRGEVIGVMGFVRPYRSGEERQSGVGRLDTVVAYIQENHATKVEIPHLAKLAHVSSRQLQRLFQAAFGMTTQAFIVRTRVQAASDSLIMTERPLAEIALAHGFCDQSAFSRAFSEHTGETPLQFRRRHRMA